MNDEHNNNSEPRAMKRIVIEFNVKTVVIIILAILIAYGVGYVAGSIWATIRCCCS